MGLFDLFKRESAKPETVAETAETVDTPVSASVSDPVIKIDPIRTLEDAFAALDLISDDNSRTWIQSICTLNLWRVLTNTRYVFERWKKAHDGGYELSQLEREELERDYVHNIEQTAYLLSFHPGEPDFEAEVDQFIKSQSITMLEPEPGYVALVMQEHGVGEKMAKEIIALEAAQKNSVLTEARSTMLTACHEVKQRLLQGFDESSIASSGFTVDSESMLNVCRSAMSGVRHNLKQVYMDSGKVVSAPRRVRNLILRQVLEALLPAFVEAVDHFTDEVDEERARRNEERAARIDRPRSETEDGSNTADYSTEGAETVRDRLYGN